MKAFRYFASHWFETLRDRRFKLAKPSDLNDPFDCVIGYKGKPTRAFVLSGAKELLEEQEKQELAAGKAPADVDKVHEERLRQLINRMRTEMIDYTSRLAQSKKGADKIVRLLCMSAVTKGGERSLKHKLSEILMWSHYAKNHAGVRIGIDLTRFNCVKTDVLTVQYSNKRPLCKLDVGLTPDADEFVRAVVSTKSKVWNYENEIRLWPDARLCVPEQQSNGDVWHYLPFKPESVFRVDFGLNMNEREQDACWALLVRDYPAAAVYKARYHRHMYSLEYELLSSPKQEVLHGLP